MTIPPGTTHVWTPATSWPVVSGFFRRAFYKKTKAGWFSYNIHGEWVKTQNPTLWFSLEKAEGFLVTLRKFQTKDFVAKKEAA